MARKNDIPKDLEIWAGGPQGLRLRRHPRLDEALKYLDEFPMVIRKPVVIDTTRLPSGARPTLELGSAPVFVRSTVGEAAFVRLEIDIPRLATRRVVQFARLFIAAGETLLEEHLVVRPGKRQVLMLPFPAWETATLFTVSMELREWGEAGKVKAAFLLKPEKRLTFYYAFQTHLDLGWTDRVEKVVASLREMTRKTAIDVCRQFMDRPEGGRFVWTCECSDALRLAWEGADAGERESLREMVRRGLIQSCALPYSFHTGLMSRDLLGRAIARSFALRREMGVEDELDLSVAQNNDVPGHSWILPDVLGEAGIHRAVIGHNHMVRGCALPPLFIMRGPGGHEVLTLASTCVDYGTDQRIPQRPEDLAGLSANNAEAWSLPGSACLHRIGHGENCGPDEALRELEAIDSWNRLHAWPRLVIGSPKDYFDHIEAEIDRSALPVVERELSDWWIDGPASTPRAMAAYRKAMILLPELERLVPPDAAADRAMLASIEENLILHAEHTFGMNAQLVKVKSAEQEWALRGLENYAGSWEDKESYATRASQAVDALRTTYALPASAANGGRDWSIQWDNLGLCLLRDPDGACWYDRAKAPDSLPFGSLVQRLLPTELDEWFHHDPPAAPAPGEYPMSLESVRGNANGVTFSGKLASPAGAIEAVEVEIVNDPGSEDLLIHLKVSGKEATAQAELLALALPFTVDHPSYVTDVGGALLRVDDDQLPDANRDAHPTIAGWVMTDRETGFSLAVSSAEVSLWHFGNLRYCDWNRTAAPRGGSVYGHLFNNVWNTNFRCWLAGDLACTLRLRRTSTPLQSLHDMTMYWSLR